MKVGSGGVDCSQGGGLVQHDSSRTLTISMDFDPPSDLGLVLVWQCAFSLAYRQRIYSDLVR